MTPTLRKAAEAAKEARKTWQRIHDSFNSGRPTLHYHCHPNDMQFLLDLADDALKAALAKQPAPSLNTDMHSILVASTELVEELPKGCDANDTGAGTPTPTTNATSPGVKSGASEHISSLIDKWADVLEIPSGSFVNEDLRGASAHILFLSAKLAEAERDAQGWAERAIRQADICDTLRAENERLRKMIAEAEAVGYGSVMCAALKGEKG